MKGFWTRATGSDGQSEIKIAIRPLVTLLSRADPIAGVVPRDIRRAMR